MGGGLLIPDPGIEPGVAHVHQDVHQHEDPRIEQHEVLDHDDVALHDGHHQRAAEPRRTENQLLPYLAGLMVVVLNIFGLFLYLIIRPKETLGEAYERQLAEESLLAEAEQRVVCPTCKERVQEEFILCPTCRTRLKRMCPSCAKLIRPEWNICPYCAKDFDERDWTVHAGGKAAE